MNVQTSTNTTGIIIPIIRGDNIDNFPLTEISIAINEINVTKNEYVNIMNVENFSTLNLCSIQTPKYIHITLSRPIQSYPS